ncbi:winged helix-turn-helix domain-containing protein [Streptomyces qinzhouensis]|uniref:Winged helix-turn-helix transcriptional regulator n=1 Tax=Streptomyces qinzhouensis TaxID=2599401 RepID=A0A5B8J7R8_9ACTN|nr:winged helix-turn-helix domain-containing protein [Streptomyces qinzhouensis]QDY76434.1 winged helix-turn-helix transcriptional regulator [Streptomyces qinzhouensis]
MANIVNSRTRTFSKAPAVAAARAAASAAPGRAGVLPPAPRPERHRLRAVAPDEVVPPGALRTLTDLLPPGATWLPAPQHQVPALPGRPPMVGYLVLVPADQLPPAPASPAVPVARQAAAPAATGPVGRGTAPSGYADGPVAIDPSERVARVGGRALDLTYLEFELLAHLVARPQRVHTRDHLVTTVWGYGHVGDGRTVDVHIARLRRKLGAEHRHTIQTVRRVGYKYAP